MLSFKPKENIGIIFVIFSYFLFSLLDAIQKTAIIYHSVFQLLLIKYLFVLILSLIESKRKKNLNFWKSKNIKLQIIRSVLSLVESGCFIISFKYLSLADTHSIGSLTPIIIVVLSVIFLKEKVSVKTWIAIFIGFLGVLIIIRPGFTVFDFKSFIPLSAAFFLGLYQVTTRKASEYDTTETSLFYTSMIGLIVASVLAYIYWQPLISESYIIFLGIGLFFSLGLYFQIIALSKARASLVQPFHYTLIFWAILLGYLFYNELPDLLTIMGSVIIVISGIYVLTQRVVE